jgi:hypothetical protein
MVHYSIEPKKISVDSYGDKFSANYDADGRVSDAGGNTVFSTSKSSAELQRPGASGPGRQVAGHPGSFPLVPGSYRFDLLLKNTVSRNSRL